MSPADTLATAIMSGAQGALFGIGMMIATFALAGIFKWIWRTYFWPPIEDLRMLAERQRDKP